MITIYDEKTGRRTWTLNKWYEKIAYVAGVISTILYTIAFLAGFISGIIN